MPLGPFHFAAAHVIGMGGNPCCTFPSLRPSLAVPLSVSFYFSPFLGKYFTLAAQSAVTFNSGRCQATAAVSFLAPVSSRQLCSTPNHCPRSSGVATPPLELLGACAATISQMADNLANRQQQQQQQQHQEQFPPSNLNLKMQQNE